MVLVSFSTVSEVVNQAGFFVAGVTSIVPSREGREALDRWVAAGLHADQRYLAERTAERADPSRLFPEARSLVVLGARYTGGGNILCPRGFGRVARYAAGRDYHRVLRKRLQAVVTEVSRRLGRQVSARVAVDSAPLLERTFAQRAGLGFLGKNTLLIRPGEGSFFFLAEILWDLEVEDIPPVREFVGCRSCTRCLSQCPTGAFVAPGVLDSGRCIAYLTIEKRGILKAVERRLLGEWVFGCDVCQEVCPFNHRTVSQGNREGSQYSANKTWAYQDFVNARGFAPLDLSRSRKLRLQCTQSREDGEDPNGRDILAEFRGDRGAGVLLNLKEVLDLRDTEAFTARFAGTPLMRAKRSGLLRNAICVAVNTGAEFLWERLVETAQGDQDGVVRATALWALVEMGRGLGAQSLARAEDLAAKARGDTHEIVRREAEELLQLQ